MHMKQHLHFAKGNFFMQYGLLMFCVLLIPLLIFYGIFTAYYFHNNRTELERSAEKVLDNSSATISGCFSDLDQMYSNFIENEKVADYMLHASAKDLKTLSSSAQQITALLNDYIVSHQYIASIYVYKDYNKYCLSSHSVYVTNNYIDAFSDSSCFTDYETSCNYITVRNAVFDNATVQYITLYYPIYIMGKELGIMAVNISDSDFFTSLNSLEKECFHAYLFQNGNLIYSSSNDAKAALDALSESNGRRYIHTDLANRYVLTGETVKQHPDLVLFTDYRESRTNPLGYVITVFLLLLVFTVMISLLLSYMIIRNIYQSIHYLIATLDSSSSENEKNHYPTEINYIAKQIINTLDRNEQFNIALNQKITELNKLQLKVLQTQITPHFLFNTLNIVSVLLSGKQAQESCTDIIKMLSDILRYSISGETYIVPFLTELEYSKKYLEIQNIRHNRKISILYDIAPELNDITIPKFTLQPILENAFSYGLSYAKKGELLIKGRLCSHVTEITISNNGFYKADDNIDALNRLLLQGHVTSSHVSGLFNVNKRLKLIYGGRYGCRITREDEKITVTISFPAVLPNEI